MPRAAEEEMMSPLAPSSEWRDEPIFSFAAGVAPAALETHQSTRTAQSKKLHPGFFRINSSLRVSGIRAKLSGTHQDSEMWSRKTASGSALDANGSTLTDAQGRSYIWDFENRLVQAIVPGTNGGTTTFKYDPFGRRIQKSGTLGVTNFLYDGFNILEEVDNAGGVLARYAQSKGLDQPLAQVWSATTSYYDADGLGTITSLSDNTGSSVETYAFGAFGNQTASSGSLANPFRYTAREFDSETGIYEYRARYFDSQIGRFISEDPMSFRAGVNFYRHVFNSPITFDDPLGLQAGGGDANTWTMGEIGMWAWVPQRGYPAPAGLGDAKASIGAACALNGGGCNSVDASGATDPITAAAWRNILNASGTDRSGGGNFMCVGGQGCWFVHECYRCVNGRRRRVPRPQPLPPSGSVSVGQNTIYFYSDPLQGWCNDADRRTGCNCH